MNVKRTIYVLLSAALLLAIPACSNHAGYYREGAVEAPTRSVFERRSTYRNAAAEPRQRQAAPTPQYQVPPHHVVSPRPIPPHPVQPAPVPVPAPMPAVPYSTAPQRSIVVSHSEIHLQPEPHATETTETPQHTQPPQQTPSPAAAVPTTGSTTTTGTTTGNTVPAGALASHTTKFDASDEGRTTNITRASSSINGHVVQPGQTFSYNETVGPTIERRGYKEGVIFVEGEKKKGFGGGVCQVSTTLSIAADEAGMTITERHDHSRPVSYAKEGEEAATSYGGIDFKFKNEKDYAVVINSSVADGAVTVSISRV